MRLAGRVGQWFIIAALLVGLVGFAPSNQANLQEGAQIADLILLARTDLAARLGIQGEAIALEGIAPLSFPCSPPNGCQGRQVGQLIHLRVGDTVYEYSGKRVGQTSILWREVSDMSAK